MGQRVVETKESHWTCGKCGAEVYYQEEAPEVCPECDYSHKERDLYDIPDELKLRIHR